MMSLEEAYEAVQIPPKEQKPETTETETQDTDKENK